MYGEGQGRGGGGGRGYICSSTRISTTLDDSDAATWWTLKGIRKIEEARGGAEKTEISIDSLDARAPFQITRIETRCLWNAGLTANPSSVFIALRHL